MNFMILSPGRRCELVKYFKEALNEAGRRLITLDMNHYAPALYFSDKWHVVTKDFANLENYIDLIIEICKKEKVSYLMTLIDPELELLSKYRRRFEENKITLILSSDNDIKVTMDKYAFYLFYKDKTNMAKTCRNYNEAMRGLELPIFAKPRYGSASIGTQKISSNEEFEAYKSKDNYVFQEYINGREIGVDVYFDLISGQIVSVFMKEKLAMRSGETDKSISIFRQDILVELKKLEKYGHFRGPVDVDMFIGEDGKVYINEINPRFGGGYPHAHFCGVNFVKLIVNNMNGVVNKASIGGYKLGVTMMKCNRYVYRSGNEIFEA